MKSKLLICILVTFSIGTLVLFYHEKSSAEETKKAAQQLFDLDQRTISLDVNAYQTLLHCYDMPTTCDIFNPGNKTDQFEAESMRLTKEKQEIISKYPYLIPSKYLPYWKVQ